MRQTSQIQHFHDGELIPDDHVSLGLFWRPDRRLDRTISKLPVPDGKSPCEKTYAFVFCCTKGCYNVPQDTAEETRILIFTSERGQRRHMSDTLQLGFQTEELHSGRSLLNGSPQKTSHGSHAPVRLCQDSQKHMIPGIPSHT